MAKTMGAVMGNNMEEEIILETERLALRRLRRADYADLCLMLKDEEVMYAYEHAFEDWEAADWLDRQLMRYEKYGFGLWAVILKETVTSAIHVSVDMSMPEKSAKWEVR